jgi:hypothetical protein
MTVASSTTINDAMLITARVHHRRLGDVTGAGS